VKTLKRKQQKVLIIGDSHAKKCATRLQHNVDANYEVSSFVKPGVHMNELTKTAREEIKTLKCEDVVVVWGGANDISRNNMKEALKHV
jgi:predicted phosphodiesterase